MDPWDGSAISEFKLGTKKFHKEVEMQLIFLTIILIF